MIWNDGTPTLNAPLSPDGMTERIGPESVVPLGVWTHLAATWNGGTDPLGIRHYIDGIEVGYQWENFVAGSRIDDSALDVWLGSCCGQSSALDGWLDDVRVYGRALHPVDVRMLYEEAGTSAPACP